MNPYGLYRDVVPAVVGLCCGCSVAVLSGFSRLEVERLARGVAALFLGAAYMVSDGARSLVKPLASRVATSGESVDMGQVAEMVDVLGLGLAAGLSFDAALRLYCENREGTLSRRMAEAELSWQMGICAREEALARAGADLQTRALGSLAAAVGQAVALGSPLSGVLDAQAREMRSAHRAAVERQIEQASVKLLIPTGTLILPALLLSIVGPLLAASGMI